MVRSSGAARLVAALSVAVLLAVACSGDDASEQTTTDPVSTGTEPVDPDSADGRDDDRDGEDGSEGAPGSLLDDEVFLLSPEGDLLHAYTTDEPVRAQEIPTRTVDGDEPRDINGQLCVFEQDGQLRFISGEDTNQPDPEAAWGVFDLLGTGVDDFEAVQVGRMLPTYQEAESSIPEQFGCGVLSDGRVVTTDIGEQALGDPTGQLIVWFPPFDSDEVAYCKIDVAIATAGQIWVADDDSVYVTSGRPPTGGVIAYSPPYPTSDDAAGGCGATDPTGAPMADGVQSTTVLVPGEHDIVSPTGVVGTDRGTFYVASVITGVINEYDADWSYLRTVVAPPDGEVIGEQSYTTGTPMAVVVGPDGSLFYADIGIVWSGEFPGPAAGEGSVRKVAFVDGEPQPPVTIAEDLAFPDGLAIVVPGSLFVMP